MLGPKEESRTPLSEIGEFPLIKHLTGAFKIHHKETILGVGDDAAVLNYSSKNHCQLVTTDLLIENIHFDLSYMPLKHLGYKSVMVNLSDLFAMNADARQITVSLAVSNRFPLEVLEELYAGISAACNRYKVDLIGGDTTSSATGLIISITAIGVAADEDVVKRNGAQDNDLLVVTGDLGGAYLGLQVLEREKQVFQVNPNNQPDLSLYTYLVERQLKPEARQDLIELLRQLGVKPTSMIDISDGLSSEVLHLTKASKLGAVVYEEHLPLDPQVISTCEEFNMDSTTVALNGGEDYELLFTLSQKDYDTIKGNPNFTVIGHMTAEKEGVHLVTRAQTKIPLIARGWDPISEQ